MQGVDQHGQQTEIPDPWLTEANPWEVRACLTLFHAVPGV